MSRPPLWASLLLLCAAAAQAGDYDFRAKPLDADELRQLQFVGYVLKPAEGRVIGSNGKPLSEETLAYFRAPYDLADLPANERQREMLTAMGFRFDEAAGRLNNPYTGSPVTRLELAYLLRLQRFGAHGGALERIHGILSKHADDAPLNEGELRQLKALAAEIDDDAVLPDAVRRFLENPALSPAAARAAAANAYEHVARFWDKQVTAAELDDLTGPFIPGRSAYMPPLPVAGWDNRMMQPALIDQAESALDAQLAKSVLERLSGNPVSAELLERFRDKDGVIRLPPLTLHDTGPRNGAWYNDMTRSININRRTLLRILAETHPEWKPDPKTLVAELTRRPDVLAAFLSRYDAALVHELTHAWQARRTNLAVETLRGNAGADDPIEWEHEAFITQSRYIHAQLAKDPASALNSDDMPRYLALLRGVDEFRDSITREYMDLLPGGASTFPTALELQKVRQSLATRLMPESPAQKIFQALKLRGLARGTEELEKARSDVDARLERFSREQFPGMQAESPPRLAALAALYARDERWNEALKTQELAVAVAKARSQPEQPLHQNGFDWMLARAEAWVRRPERPGSAERRAETLSYLNAHYKDRGGLPADLAILRDQAYAHRAREVYEMGLKEKDPVIRRQFFDGARDWAAMAGDKEVLRLLKAAGHDGPISKPDPKP